MGWFRWLKHKSNREVAGETGSEARLEKRAGRRSRLFLCCLGFQGLRVLIAGLEILLEYLRVFEQRIGHGDILLHDYTVGFEEPGLVLFQKLAPSWFGQP